MSRMFGERWSSQASATWSGVASSEAATSSSTEDWTGLKPPSGKYGKVVLVLHADDLRKALPFLNLRPGDIAQADVLHQALLLEFDKYGKWFFDGAVLRK